MEICTMSVEFTIDDALSYSFKNTFNLTEGFIISTTIFNEYIIVGVVKTEPQKCVEELEKICNDNNISDWGLLLKNTDLSQQAMHIIKKYQ